ncbi:hypothetical protein Vafri_3456 [Volvox africanus]|uniref:Uncharacterized protein n=1 Tax=Volvox africanus TaxID=51714 RepID=A0A8J4AUD4_9CHLO|nr:hypothetical protein Vafri_3456 [Volvox africanus]
MKFTVLLHALTTLVTLVFAAEPNCPSPPVVYHTSIIAVCSNEPARSAIGCSMYRFCNNENLRPAIFPQLCSTLKIASSLCNDDPPISSRALCTQLRAPYTGDAQFRSCLPPYPINSTSAIKALHLHACDEMEGYPGDPMAGCDTCTDVSCPDPLASLSAGCIGMPMGQCDGLDALCALGASVLCKKNLKDAPMRPPSPPPEPLATVVSTPPPLLAKSPSPSSVAPSPPNLISPCIANSSLPECASYEYPTTSISADIASLCNMMPYMPSCTMAQACKAGNVTGDFCRPMTLLATICVDMPSMSGCKSYVALCKNTSVVQQCRSFPAIPGLPTTAQARLAVVIGLCAANRTAMTPAVQNLTTVMCAACNQLSCSDYLTPLSSICNLSPTLSGCSTYQSWCSASAAWQVAAGSSISSFCKKLLPPPAGPPIPEPVHLTPQLESLPPSPVANKNPPQVVKKSPPPAVMKKSPPPAVMKKSPPPAVMKKSPPPAVMKKSPPPAVMKKSPPPAVMKKSPPPAVMKKSPPPAVMKKSPPPAVMKKSPPPAVMKKSPPPAVMKKSPQPAVMKKSPQPAVKN